MCLCYRHGQIVSKESLARSWNHSSRAELSKWSVCGYTSGMSTTTPSTPLNRVLQPISECLTRDVAERVINAPLNGDLQERLNVLAEKANDGALTAEEQYEYEQYVEGIDLLGIFKAQARLALLRLTS